MKSFEVILILVVIAAASAQMTKRAIRWSMSLILLGVLVAAWHIRELTHWQMFPALAGLVLLIICQLNPVSFQLSRHPAAKNSFMLSVAILSSTSFGSLLLVPMFTLPKPTGPYPVGTRILYLKDTSRTEDQGPHPGGPRELMVQMWYPATSSNNHLAAYQRMSETTLATSYRSVLWTNSRIDAPIATNGAPFVVLLFNHRWGGLRTQNTFLTEDLASHGYVVVAIDHPYNAGRVAMPDGRVIKDVYGYGPIDVAEHNSTQIREIWNKELKKWVADEVFVLNTLQNDNLDRKSPWYGRLDTDRAGAFGHSFGGAASVQVCSVDSRIRSALNLDGWTFGNIRHRASSQSTMFLYGATHRPRPQDLLSKDPAAQTEAELDVIDAKQIDASLRQYGGYRLFVDTASHMDFTDHSLVSPWRNWIEPGHISPARIQTIVRTYVLAFFDETLRGRGSALLHSGNSGPFSEVQSEQFYSKSKAEPADAAQRP